MLNVDYWPRLFNYRGMSVLEAAISLVAPPGCVGCGAEGMALCNRCKQVNILPFGGRCAFCSSLSSHSRTCSSCQRPGGPRFVWVATTHEGLAQELVRVYKFGHLRAAAGPLSSMMKDTLLGSVGHEYAKAANYLIVPLPTATGRTRQRGFDHAALLAKNLSRQLGLEYCPGLGRLGQSRQVGASRQTRLGQQAGNYVVRRPRQVAGRNVLLIDDVITTGGSLLAASKSLRAAGAKHIDAVVFAKRL